MGWSHDLECHIEANKQNLWRLGSKKVGHLYNMPRTLKIFPRIYASYLIYKHKQVRTEELKS